MNDVMKHRMQLNPVREQNRKVFELDKLLGTFSHTNCVMHSLSGHPDFIRLCSSLSFLSQLEVGGLQDSKCTIT